MRGDILQFSFDSRFIFAKPEKRRCPGGGFIYRQNYTRNIVAGGDRRREGEVLSDGGCLREN